ERFLGALGYRGIAAVEFKRDLHGALKMIEINVRPSLWFSLTSAAGKRPVLAAYHDLAGSSHPLAEGQQENGVRWRYFLKDAWSSLFYLLNRGFLLPPPDVLAVGTARTQHF